MDTFFYSGHPGYCTKYKHQKDNRIISTQNYPSNQARAPILLFENYSNTIKIVQFVFKIANFSSEKSVHLIKPRRRELMQPCVPDKIAITQQLSIQTIQKSISEVVKYHSVQLPNILLAPAHHLPVPNHNTQVIVSRSLFRQLMTNKLVVLLP